MSEKDYGPNKKATYTYEEVRALAVSAMKDRAKTLGAFYQVMPKELFHEYATKAMFAYGAAKADRIPEKNSPEAFANFLISCNSVANTCADKNSIVEITDEYAHVRFDGVCALVEGWREMGITPEEVDYLCQVQSYGDYGHTDAVGCKGEFLCTSAQPGCDHCEFKITKK